MTIMVTQHRVVENGTRAIGSMQDSHWPGRRNWFGERKSGNFARGQGKSIYHPCFSAVALWLLHFSTEVRLLPVWVSPHCCRM